MKAIILILLFLLALLLYGLLAGEGSIPEVLRLKQVIAEQKSENSRMKQDNDALAAELADLKQGLDAVEERARSELGMIKKDETYYQIIN